MCWYMYIVILISEILQYENLDLQNIHTPVNYRALDYLLKDTSYDESETKFLVQGFKNGFDLGYRGSIKIQLKAPNLKFTIGDEIELWNKVMGEVREKRYAGPFDTIPFQHFIQSPIGLVPKEGGAKTRFIFHLSYPRGEQKLSVNSNTPPDMSTVKYPDFSEAVLLCIRAGPGCAAAKSDLSAAFRHLGILKSQWCLLVMKAKDPLQKKWKYFVDKCMPFGAGISCANFQ